MFRASHPPPPRSLCPFHDVECRQRCCPCFSLVSPSSILHKSDDSQVRHGAGAQPSNLRRAGLSLNSFLLVLLSFSYLCSWLHFCPRSFPCGNDMFTSRQSSKTHRLLNRHWILWKDLEFDSLVLCPATVCLVE